MNFPACAAVVFFTLAGALRAVPGNDDFIHRKKLPSQESIEESLRNAPRASYETLDPLRRPPNLFPSDLPDGSLWWEWTAPRDGWFLIGTSTGEPIGELDTYVFTGEDLEHLVPVRNGNGNGLTPDWKTFFEAHAGKRYQIGVRTSGHTIPSVNPSLATLKITPCPPPLANDTLERRAILSGPLPVILNVSNVAAPSEELSLLNSMARLGSWYDFSGGDGPVQWWEWKCPESGRYVLRMESGYSQAALAAQRRMITAGVPGPPGDWVPNGVTLDGAGFMATAGAVYDLAVRTADNTFAPYTLIFGKEDTSLPANRTREAAVEMPSVLPSLSWFSWTRTEGPAQDDEQVPLWWVFTAPGQGLYAFSGSGYPLILHYEPGNIHTESMVQYLQTGERVWIQSNVPRFAGAGFDTNISFYVAAVFAGAVAANDMLAEAVDLASQTEFQLTGDRQFATLEAGERTPLSGADRVTGSLWWKWTAPADGWLHHGYILKYAPLEVIAGTDPATGQLQQPFQHGEMVFSVQGGQAYMLRVLFSDEPDEENCSMKLDFLARPVNLAWQTAMDLGVIAEPSWRPKNSIFDVSSGTAQWFKWTAAESGTFDMFWQWEPFTLYSDPVAGIEVPRASLSGTWELHAGQTYWLKYGTGKSDDWFAITREMIAEHGDIATALVLHPELPAAGTANARGDVNSPAEHQALLKQIPWLERSNKGVIWWKWTAPKDQCVRCRVEDRYNQMEYLFAFSGDTPKDEIHLHSGPQDQEGRYFFAAQGITYWFALASREDSAARALLYRLELWPGEMITPANDAFANSVEISHEDWEDRNFIPVIHRAGGGRNPWRYEFTRATLEPGEPPLTPVPMENGEEIEQTGSTWWHWTAPREGVYKIQLVAPESDDPVTPGDDVTLSIFAGSTLASLEPVVMHRPQQGEYLFRAQRGVRYSIRAASGEETGTFGLLAVRPPLSEMFDYWAIEKGYFDLIGFADFIDTSDGITNLRKVMFGMDPHYHADHPLNLSTRANLPRQVLRDGVLEMRCRPDPSMVPEGYPLDLQLNGELSADLVSWHEFPPEQSDDGELILRVPVNSKHRFLKWDVLKR
ncbi:MAG TPA: hypothetical protein VG796_26855 [Verrucomicrobiales bacterium]|nr:hypothetical protein [Verrucomicrobiales bacterium]